MELMIFLENGLGWKEKKNLEFEFGEHFVYAKNG